jgi:exopolyphosphatase/guanosine-5'-triphosphate,3'-diphosphate pyrophosphatase
VPRWEWRAFGARFGRVEDAFDAAGAAQESDEVYLLAAAEANVKIRAGLVDVKVVRETNADGLERWEPVMKEGFPLAAGDVERVLGFLGVTAPNLAREAYDEAQLRTEVIDPAGGVRAIAVHKVRTRSTVGGCMAEIADVATADRAIRTIAIEGEDPVAVAAAIRGVHLVGWRNTSYPRGLAELLDGEPARYAVIDVGTNSVKFDLAERTDDGWRTIVDRAEVTRLGEGIEVGGAIVPVALARTADAIAGMAGEARAAGVRSIAAVGTAALRAASNAEDAIATIRERSGLTVEVISGDEESRLAYLAATAGLGGPRGSSLVFDTGGGSSQFTFGHRAAVDDRFSLPVGAARFTERFGLDRAVGADVVADARAAIAAELTRLEDRPVPDEMIGMGGAITNMTAVMLELPEYDPGRVQGATLTDAEVDRQIERYRALDADGRRAIVGLQPKRAEVILAGACIVWTVLATLGRSSLTVSDRALRHGVLAERFGPAPPTVG